MIDLDKILVPGGYPVSAQEIRDEIERLRKIESAASYYYEHFLQDEADDMECCFSEDQHHAAVALRNALSQGQTK